MIPISPWASVSWISRAMRRRSSETPASRAWVSSCSCSSALWRRLSSSRALASVSADDLAGRGAPAARCRSSQTR